MKRIKHYILSALILIIGLNISAQEAIKLGKLKRQYYYENNCIAYPGDVMPALFRIFDNKDFANERSKMTVAQANLFLWNAVANVTIYTKLNAQLKQYADYETEIESLFRQLGYDEESISCIQLMFAGIKENPYYQSPGCAVFNESDSLILTYLNHNLNQLVSDENGKLLDKKFTGQISYYSKHDFEYVNLNLKNGAKQTAEYYGEDLDLHRVSWYYPSGTLRYQGAFTETGKRIMDTWFYPVSQITKREIAYFENGAVQSDVEYDSEGHLNHEVYFTQKGKKIMTFSIVTLTDGTTTYAPIESYNENGEATLQNGTGYLDVYSYNGNEKKLMSHQIYKNYLLDGTTTENDPGTGKCDYEYANGILISSTNYYKTGEIKKQIFFKNEEVVSVKTYPKYKNFDILVEESTTALNQVSIVNKDNYEEKLLDEKLECANCIEVLKDIFNKEWAGNNPDIFEKEMMQFSISLQINNKAVVVDSNIYDSIDLYSQDAITFEDAVKENLLKIRYKKMPKLNDNEVVQINASFNIKLKKK